MVISIINVTTTAAGKSEVDLLRGSFQWTVCRVRDCKHSLLLGYDTTRYVFPGRLPPFEPAVHFAAQALARSPSLELELQFTDTVLLFVTLHPFP